MIMTGLLLSAECQIDADLAQEADLSPPDEMQAGYEQLTPSLAQTLHMPSQVGQAPAEGTQGGKQACAGIGCAMEQGARIAEDSACISVPDTPWPQIVCFSCCVARAMGATRASAHRPLSMCFVIHAS